MTTIFTRVGRFLHFEHTWGRRHPVLRISPADDNELNVIRARMTKDGLNADREPDGSFLLWGSHLVRDENAENIPEGTP